MEPRTTVCLVAMHTHTGMPLFNRTFNRTSQIPEVVFISLNSVHSFCQSFSISLVKTYAGNQSVWWNSFNENMMLILVVDESNRKRREKKGKEGWKEGKGGMRVREGEEDDWVYKRVFTLVQRCIVFKVGHDQLDAPYEELKEALQASLGVLDCMLMSILGGSVTPSSFPLLSLSNSVSFSPNQHLLRSRLEEFISTTPPLSAGAIFVASRRVAATKKLLNLPLFCASLIQFYVCEGIHAQSSQSALSKFHQSIVFLSHHRLPQTAWRLASMEVMPGCLLCLLSQQEVAMETLLRAARSFWGVHADLLLEEEIFKTPSPSNKHVLSYILVSRSKGSSLISGDVQQPYKQHASLHEDLLAFYIDSVSGFYSDSDNLLAVNANLDVQFELQAAQSFSVTCTYTCCGGHKLYSESASDGLEVWLLCDKAMPTFAMRSVAKELVTSIRQLKWVDI